MNQTKTFPKRFAPGVEFTVKGHGRFRLVRVRDNGELNAWGPIADTGNVPHGMMRTFRPEQVTRVHVKMRAGG